MLYSLECSYCGLVSEHMMLMDEMDKKVDCPHCTGKLSRREHRLYDVPMIQGDTVAGSHNFSGYYDAGMDEFVTSRSHRKDLMEKHGLVEFSPDPEMKKHRDEARYIRERSTPKDVDAQVAIQKEYKTAETKRRTKNVKRAFEQSLAESK
jgi:hypothetical protein